MKPILTLLALAAVGLALVGCDPKPAEDPSAPAATGVKAGKPTAPAMKADAAKTTP